MVWQMGRGTAKGWAESLFLQRKSTYLKEERQEFQHQASAFMFVKERKIKKKPGKRQDREDLGDKQRQSSK